ncbi:hypothetical protein BDR07DRAFT_1463609 [Suillus spraguei]|nr:hypothetical protein BDR07DRAFT_1463609 [Suillus spraguei]
MKAPSKPLFSSLSNRGLKVACIALHIVPIIIHFGLFLLYYTGSSTTIRSTTYSVFVLFVECYLLLLISLYRLMQALIFRQQFCGEFRLTAVYDIMNAMYGSGAALAVFWDQLSTATVCSEAIVFLLYIIVLTVFQPYGILSLVLVSKPTVASALSSTWSEIEVTLELDHTSNLIALLASCSLLGLLIAMLARRTGSSVWVYGLSFMWLTKHSEHLTTQFARIPRPDYQVLRRAGMFRVRVQDSDGTIRAIDGLPDIANELQRLGTHEETETHRPRQSKQYYICMGLHILFVILNALLYVAIIRDKTHDIMFSTSHTKMWEFGIRHGIQAYYTLSIAALVYCAQRVTLDHDLARFQSLSSLYDVRDSWGNWLAASISLTGQFRYPGSTSRTRIFCVFSYLFSLSSISSLRPYILSPQSYTITTNGLSSTQLAWPDPAINLSTLDWNAITLAALPSSQIKGVVTTGLSGGLLYDKLFPNSGFGTAVVNATLIDADCSLLPSSFWSNTDGSPRLEDFISVIPWSDHILHIASTENHLTFLVTTAMAGSGVVLENASVSMPWVMHDSNGHEVSSMQVIGYMVACHMSLEKHAASVDVQSNLLLDTTYNSVSPDDRWTIFTGNSPSTDQALDWFKAPFLAKPFEGTPMEAIYWNNSMSPGTCVSGSNGGMCRYMPERLLMDFLNMTQEQIIPTIFNDSTPTFTLSPLKLERALSQYFGTMIWTAAQLGGRKGGFDRATGQAEINQNVTTITVHLSHKPLLGALVISLICLVLIFVLAGFRPGCKSFVGGFGALHMIWLTTRLPKTAKVLGSTPRSIYLDSRHLRYIGECIKVQLADEVPREEVDEVKLEKFRIENDLEKEGEGNDDSVTPIPPKVEPTQKIDDNRIEDDGDNQVCGLERGDRSVDKSRTVLSARTRVEMTNVGCKTSFTSAISVYAKIKWSPAVASTSAQL